MDGFKEEKIIIVDKNDNEIGTCSKMEAHLTGKLHRAFSIFIFNSELKMLIQKRAYIKYHSSGLWSNACCSHPRELENTEHAAHRRLLEELGFDCEIKEIFSFKYKIGLENNMYENEYDHVFIGKYDGNLSINYNEVDSYSWITLKELKYRIENNPEEFTYWFKFIINDILKYVNTITVK